MHKEIAHKILNLDATKAYYRNRMLFFAGVAITSCLLVSAMAAAIFSAQPGLLGWMLFLACLPELPFIVPENLNAALGIYLRRSRQPMSTGADGDAPLPVRTAIVMTIRNEAVAPVFGRLQAIQESVDRTDHKSEFDYFILSDSDQPDICRAEDEAIDRWKAREVRPDRVNLLRRSSTEEYKNGNLISFCRKHNGDYELLLVLDADSLMTGNTIVSLAQIMSEDSSIGILQTLCVATPSVIPFTRCFQFGLRHRLRCITAGAAWWRGNHGQYWGHNCMVRLAPFVEECDLQRLSRAGIGSGHEGAHLIHDQLEAALMNRAGFGVYLIPIELGSFEANPTSLQELLMRQGRWGRGNIENLRHLKLEGLTSIGRIHLATIAAIHIGGACAFAFVFLALLAVVIRSPLDPDVSPLVAALYYIWMFMLVAPRGLGVADALLRHRADYGGGIRLVAGGLMALMLHLLITPLLMFEDLKTVCVAILGRKREWTTAFRDAQTIGWKEALLQFWPQTMLGLAAIGVLLATAPAALPWFIPFFAGLALSVPFAVFGVSPVLGGWLEKNHLCAMPEEIEARADVVALMNTSVEAAEMHLNGR